MKLWLKHGAGILVGVLLALVAPASLFEVGGLLRQAAEASLRIGYYVFLPLLVVGLPLSVMKLGEEGRLWPLAWRSLLYFLASSFAASLLGVLTALLSDQQTRLPLLSDLVATQGESLRLAELLPRNLGALASFSGDLALPLLLLGLVVGLAMTHDPTAAKPVANLLDSASRILYTINTFTTEVLSALLIPVAAKGFHTVSASLEGGAFVSFAAALGMGAAALAFVAFPLVVYLASGRRNPFPYLFAFLASSLAALAAGDLRFAAGTTLRESVEDFGLRRRHSSLCFPLGLVFGRVGTAFATAFCSIFILSSYSPLAVTIPNILLLLAIVPAASIAGGLAVPGGTIAAITLTCGLFGKGFENGYLVMAPIAFLLSVVATTLDILWLGVSQVLCDRSQPPAARKKVRHYI